MSLEDAALEVDRRLKSAASMVRGAPRQALLRFATPRRSKLRALLPR
jgi:hypothetical protein